MLMTALFENEMLTDEFFDMLNNAYSFMKFSMDQETNNELAFLDVIIKCKNNKFLTCLKKENFYKKLSIKL